jgi:hypothetical protein
MIRQLPIPCFLILLPWLCSNAVAQPMLWNAGHEKVVTTAVSLLSEPEIKAARDKVQELYETALPFQWVDGKRTMQGAIDELVYGVLLTTASVDEINPDITWIQTMSYEVAGVTVPGNRYAGDTPDRLYRFVDLDPTKSYRLSVRPDSHEPLDFSIEALAGPAVWGLPPLNVIRKADIEKEDDGSFVITMDSSPSEGRPNHLQLPEKSISLLIRDTLSDWQIHRPYHLSIKGLSPEAGTISSREQMIAFSVDQIIQSAETSVKFYADIWSREVNRFDAFVRWSGDIAPSWGIVAINRFDLADDEAIVVTVDTIGANYFGIQVDDLWLRSVEHVRRTSTLNDQQAIANPDGTFTFVISKTDPGYINWVDTGGMNQGYLIGRWDAINTENLSRNTNAVTFVQKTPLSKLGSLLPNDFQKITPAQRRQQIDLREADFYRRYHKNFELTVKP